MTKAEAKKVVCKHVADLINGQLDCGWPFEHYHSDISDEDYKRMWESFRELVGELERRGSG